MSIGRRGVFQKGSVRLVSHGDIMTQRSLGSMHSVGISVTVSHVFVSYVSVCLCVVSNASDRLDFSFGEETLDACRTVFLSMKLQEPMHDNLVYCTGSTRRSVRQLRNQQGDGKTNDTADETLKGLARYCLTELRLLWCCPLQPMPT